MDQIDQVPQSGESEPMSFIEMVERYLPGVMANARDTRARIAYDILTKQRSSASGS